MLSRKQFSVAGSPVEEVLEVPFLGKWRIVEMDEGGNKSLDEDGPACISFEDEHLGQLHFLLIHAQVDWSYDPNIDRVDFSFEGFEELDL